MRYGVIYHRFWHGKRMRTMDDAQRLLLAYLMANTHANVIGFYVFSPEYASADLQSSKSEWTTDAVTTRLAELERVGAIQYDADARVILLTDWLLWRKINNINVAIRARKVIEELPDSVLHAAFRKQVVKHVPEFAHIIFGGGTTPPPETKAKAVRKLSDRGEAFVKLWDTHSPGYIWNARDRMLVDEFTGIFTDDQIKKAIPAFFEMKDDWLLSAGYTLPVFKSRLNTLIQQQNGKLNAPKKLAPGEFDYEKATETGARLLARTKEQLREIYGDDQ